MQTELNRRHFLFGAQALVMAGFLNRAYAGVPAAKVAADEGFWEPIREAYGHDPLILNLNNGGVAPAPSEIGRAHV